MNRFLGVLNIDESFLLKKFGNIRQIERYWHFLRYQDIHKVFRSKMKKMHSLSKRLHNFNYFSILLGDSQLVQMN